MSDVELSDAIYARQSVDRMDSISVESQVEFCKKEVIGQQIKVYTDKGYSGKNIDRPAFSEMLGDIRAGRIRRVIVYRLDRISRSVLDFAGVIDIFQKHHVEFVSTMEKFDTGTPIGKAMLMIVMIFAQLERETIQQRVIDAYGSRSRRGFYMGGRVPYGFSLKETAIDGVRTKAYEIVEGEADVVRLIYSLYSEPQTSLGDVMRCLESNGIKKRDGGGFSRSRLRELIINPVYVRADYLIYRFFKEQGADAVNAPEDFIGVNGAYLYSGENTAGKTVSLKGQTLVLAPHEGLVDADLWLKCRVKCLNNKSIAKPVKAKATWLAGKIKCAECGYALTAKVCRCKTKSDNRYYICSGKGHGGVCGFGSADADFIDGTVLLEMRKKLADFPVLAAYTGREYSAETVRLKTRIDEIDAEISALLDRVKSANDAVMLYINERISLLDAEKRELCEKIAGHERDDMSYRSVLNGYMEHWESIGVSDRLTVVDCLIERIEVSKGSIEIRWKI